MCVRAFSDALEVIPYTLAENAGIFYILLYFRIKSSCCSDRT